jgi:hypothetical protein
MDNKDTGWLSRQFDNCERTVAAWSKEKKIACGLLIPIIEPGRIVGYRERTVYDIAEEQGNYQD